MEEIKANVKTKMQKSLDSLKKLIKDKEISEDDERRSQDEVQKSTDQFINEIDKLTDLKEKDLLVI